MKNNKKLLLLSLVPLLVLSACAKGGRDRSGGDDSSGGGGGGGKVGYQEISIFKNDWSSFTEARNSNSPVYKKIHDDVNIDIKCISGATETWEDSISTKMASKSLEDMFLTRGPDNSKLFKDLIRTKNVVAISDYVTDNQTYPNLYKHLQQFEFMKKNIKYANGKLYFIPSAWHLEKSLYVRQDWINNLNNKLGSILAADGICSEAQYNANPENYADYKYKIPENLLDFYHLARGFTLFDPDGDGRDNTTGYVSESNKDMDAWIYAAFEAGWDQFVKDGETYTYSDISTGAKSATAFIVKLMSEGFMAASSTSNSNDAKQSAFMAGQSGMMYAHNWYNNIIGGIMDANNCSIEEAVEKVALAEPPAGETGKFGGAGASGYWEGFCINAKIGDAKIRKCLELYDYLLSDEGYNLIKYGVEGEHFEVQDGKKVSKLAVDTKGFRKSLRSVDPATQLYALVEWTMGYKNEIDTNGEYITAQHKKTEKHSMFSDYPCLVTDKFVEKYDSVHTVFTKQVDKFKANAGTYYAKQDGKGSFDIKKCTYAHLAEDNFEAGYGAAWDSFVTQYKNQGGTAINNEYNLAIKDAAKAGEYIYR